MVAASEQTLKKKIVETHVALYHLGFSVANDGNTSARLSSSGTIIITPKGLAKHQLRAGDIVAIDGSGKKLKGKHSPSSELHMHTAIYKARPDVHAIIHAHPPYSIAATLVGISMEEPILPEVVIAFKRIPTAPYSLTGTKEMASSVVNYLENADGVLLERHGVVTVGSSLDEALQKLERIEHTAKILLIAKSCGKITPLDPREVEKLLALRKTTR